MDESNKICFFSYCVFSECSPLPPSLLLFLPSLICAMAVVTMETGPAASSLLCCWRGLDHKNLTVPHHTQTHIKRTQTSTHTGQLHPHAPFHLHHPHRLHHTLYNYSLCLCLRRKMKIYSRFFIKPRHNSELKAQSVRFPVTRSAPTARCGAERKRRKNKHSV